MRTRARPPLFTRWWPGSTNWGKRCTQQHEEDAQRTDFFGCSDLPIDLRYTLGSFINRQYPGAVAHFYGPAGEHQYSSTAPEDSPNDEGFEIWKVDPC
ncbi:hypothetical protein E1181_25320 [Saccharopolyspora terrae]|uniref:Uncharacterized protein n=1 Tax=Saccharopolyspora terrae TaxID=2530384 RepID=A0A4V2Y9W7_9PSEU|nr:hypothetical protein [Saccharopolyspora terrae]TDD01416.1 hypothetical protein E1181_25320 [Saccharopolyspora terrae]